MKKLMGVTILVTLCLSFALGVTAAVPVRSGAVVLDTEQDYETGTANDFAYACHSAGEIITVDGNNVMDLGGKKHLEASIDGLENTDKFVLEFDVKAQLASSELCVYLKRDASSPYSIRIRPGTFVPLIEKKRSDFPIDSQIYQKMWMNSATAENEDCLVGEEWLTFKIIVESAKLGDTITTDSILNAVTIQYKAKSEKMFKLLEGSKIEAPWKPGWVPAKNLLCNKSACNVAIQSAGNWGQQHAVWFFDEENDSVDFQDTSSRSHYQIDNLRISGGEYTNRGVIHHEDYEGENPTLTFGKYSTYVKDENGNTYMKVDIPSRLLNGGLGQHIYSDAVTAESLPEGFIMTVDLCMLDKNSVDFKLEYFSDSFGSTQINESTGQTESIAKVYGDYAFSRWNWNVNEWYRLKLVKFPNIEKPVGTLCNLETGEIWYLNTEANKESAISSKTNYNRFFFHCGLYNITRTFKWGVDNFTLTELGAVSLISATKVEDCVEAIASVDASRDQKASGAAVTPILAIYKDDVLVDIDSRDAKVESFEGTTQKLRVQGEYDCAKLLLWDENGGLNPLVNVIDITNEIVEKAAVAPDGYSAGFFQDWKEIGEWDVSSEVTTVDTQTGIIRMTSQDESNRHAIKRSLNLSENYDVEFRLMFPEIPEDEFADGTWLYVSSEKAHTWIKVCENMVYYMHHSFDGQDPDYSGPNYAIPYDLKFGEWQTWKAEVRNGFVTWFVNGKELVSYKMLVDGSVKQNCIEIRHEPSTFSISDVMCDWIRYTPYFKPELKIVSPANTSIFDEGTNVELKADCKFNTAAVDYYVNNVYVGSGLAENEFAYTLKSVKPGKYRVKAVVKDNHSLECEFAVKNTFAATLELSADEISSAEVVKAVAKADERAVCAEFYLDGILFATDNEAPFEAEYSNLKVGSNTVFARIYARNGIYAETEPKVISTSYVSEQELKIGREYELMYKYDGMSGSFELKDGYFNLYLNHNGNTIAYKTPEGTEIYTGIGAGDYKVVVASGYGELYRNNQFVMSFFMPYAPDIQQVQYFGVSDVSIKASGVKEEVLHYDWLGENDFVKTDINHTGFYTIEFDKTDSSSETIMFKDGMFENVINFCDDGIYVRHELTRDDEPETLKICDDVKPGYYRVTVNFGLANIYLNNKSLGSYRCVETGSRTKLQRTMTNPMESTFVAIKNLNEIYYHDETFEGTNEFSHEDYWGVYPETYRDGEQVQLTTKRVIDSDGNAYMNIAGTGTYILNVVDKNPLIKWRAMVENRTGVIYTVVRRSFADRHTKIGYNFETEEWFFEIVDNAGTVVESKTQGAALKFEAGKWYDFELICKDFKLTLMCDGIEVFIAEMPKSDISVYYGRIGFGTKESQLNIDDVKYMGENRVTAGVTFTNGGRYGQTTVSNTAAEFYKDTDGNIVATGGENTIISKDNGKTWGDVVLKSDVDNKGRIFSEQLVIMPDGTMVKVNPRYGSAQNLRMTANISYDGGKSWTANYLVSDDCGGLGSVARLTCTKDGRLFLCTFQGTASYGHQSVLYSDDGKEWHKSNTTFTTHNTGIIMNEATVVDTPRKDEVWFIARSDSGYIDYWISYDNGKTFDLTPHHTGLIAPQSCFKVVRDWENPDTYYAIFLYDAETLSQRSYTHPRCRVSLAVSYDGMQNWEYVTDLMESNDWPVIHTSDSVVKKIDGALYWRTSSAGDAAGINFGVQQIDNIKPLKRMPAVHSKYFIGFDLLEDGAKDHVVLPKNSGKAWIFGNYADVSVLDGRCDLATVEKIFGVDTVQNDLYVSLVLGGSKVTFKENDVRYTINGTIKVSKRAAYFDGYLDIKTLVEIYGKDLKESENSFLILDGTELVEKYQKMMNDLAE